MRGFENTPTGSTLARSIQGENGLGFAYERVVGFYKDFHIHDRSILVFLRGSSRMESRTRSPQHRYQLDSGKTLYIPEHIEHDDEATSTIVDLLMILPKPGMLEEIAVTLGYSPEMLGALKHPQVIERSQWLNDLVERYYFERMLTPNPIKESLTFLERQILSEFLRIVLRESAEREGVLPGAAADGIAQRALRFIETKLFEPIELKDIARAAGCSVPTLLRSFRREFDRTPHSYMKSRRLDEAQTLLKSGQQSVSEVAALVGYQDLSAFSKAYKAKFGINPRDLKRGRDG